MNLPKQPKSLQEILKQRQQTTFVGREPQIAMFRQNMGRSPELRDYFIFNVWGQGGVGKSTLLRQFRKIADEAQFATALTSDSETTVPEAMGRLAEQFEQSGHKLTQFSDRYKLYRQKKQELESDPDAPQGFSAFVGKSIAKAGLGLAKQVPGSGAVTPFIDEDAFTSQAGEWASYVAKKLGNKDEVQLVNEPVEVLTPLFVQELNHLAEKANLVLFFDTYERTSPFLDAWLRELLDGRHGELPANLLLVIAGRDELDKNYWVDSENFIARFPLNPFTDEEAIQYLHRKGITNDQIIEVILHLSGRLPLLVTTLAATSPNDPTQIGDPSETAVERFLQWIDDPKKRQVAIDASLPRLLNRDIIAVLQGEETADDLFNWLKSMPFVEQRPDGWAYHDIARTQMLRYKRRTSPQSWADIHCKLAGYYDTQRTGLQLDEKTQWTDATWQVQALNVLYHQLCKAPQAQLSKSLNEFLAALKAKRKFAEEWADMMHCAGKDSDASELSSWGKQLSGGLTAYNENNYESVIETFTVLLNLSCFGSIGRATALNWRGYNHYLLRQYEQALADLTESIELSPQEVKHLADRGAIYNALKQYEAALQDLNQAIELDPKNKWAIANRGVTYRKTKLYEEAIEDLDKAIELDPKDVWTINERGRVSLAAQSYEEAVKIFTQVIELNSQYKWAIASRGLAYQLLENYEDALQDFNRAIELNLKDALVFAERGETYRLMKRYEEALQDFNQAIELDPKFSWAIIKRGQTYKAMKRYDEALNGFNRAIELDPNSAWKLAQRGVTYQLMKRYEEALQSFNQAIELDPKYSWAITNRGITHREMKRYEEALQDFNLAIELDPKHEWVIASRGRTYRAMKQYDEALNDFNQAIELDPTSDWKLAGRGETYRLMKCYEEALQDFNQAIELDSEYSWAITKRGQVYEVLTQYDKALQDFDRAVELDPKYAWAIRKRGEIYLMMGRNSEALADFDRAIELKPDIDWNLYSRALAYKVLNQLNNAQPDFGQAIKLAQQSYNEKPDDHRNTFNLAIYHLAAGNLDQSKHFYRDALNRGASSVQIREAIRDLENFLRVFPGHEAAQAFKQGLEKRVSG